MFTDSLSKHVQDYLSKAASVAEQRAAGKEALHEIGELEQMRIRLLEEVSPPHDPGAEALVDALRAFLDAEVGYECWKAKPGQKIDSPGLERLRNELLGQVNAFCRVSRCRKRVLIAVDGSEQAQWAAEIGGELAETLNAEIMLVQVLPIVADVAPTIEVLNSRVEKIYKQETAILDAARQILPPSVKTRQLVRVGVPAEEIVAVARDWDADYIVIGTHGRGRVATFFLGSTAESVVRRANCPVLTVASKPKCRCIADQPSNRTMEPTALALQH